MRCQQILLERERTSVVQRRGIFVNERAKEIEKQKKLRINH